MSEELLTASRRFITSLWSCSVSSCIPMLDKDFWFIGPFAYSVGSGPNELVEYCRRVEPVISHLRYEHLNLRCVHQDHSMGIVIGIANVTSGNSELPGVRARCTFIWKLSTPEPKLVHAHISVPVIMSNKQGLEGVARPPAILQEALAGRSASAPLTLRDTEGTTRVVHFNRTAYLEAQHQYTVVHMLSDSFRVRESLKRMLERFPSYFVQVHRSYAVNATLIASVNTSEIRLINGEAVPIPTKRSAEVRAKLLAAITDDSDRGE